MSHDEAMVGADRLSRQWQRYGSIMSEALRLDPAYSEDQCGECPYGHRCCTLLVSVTPYEALGIMSWIKSTVADSRGLLNRVKMRAEAMRDWMTDKKGRPRFTSTMEMAVEWSKRRLPCVFYSRAAQDGAGGCTIYPVRPVKCRTAFGRGDCSDEMATGVVPMQEDPDVRASRERRVRVQELEQHGQAQGELCLLITMLRTPHATPIADPDDQRLLHAEPETLTDDQVMFGLGARPRDNPWNEEPDNGDTRRTG